MGVSLVLGTSTATKHQETRISDVRIPLSARKNHSTEYEIDPYEFRVRLVGELCILGLKKKIDKEMSVWFTMHAIDRALGGTGALRPKEALYYLESVFNFARTTVYDRLNDGEGIFWNRIECRKGTIIKLKSLNDVCRHFNTYKLSRFKDFLPESFNRLQKRRGCFLISFDKTQDYEKAKPITRVSRCEATSVSPRQQQRWEKVVPVIVKPQRAWYYEGDQLKPKMVDYPGKTKMYRVQQFLGNVYHCKVVSTGRGMCSKIRRSTERSSNCKGEALRARRFFRSPQMAIKARDKDREAYLLVSRITKRGYCRPVWALV